MSTFQENFQRAQSEQLNYDDTAFYYWAFAMLFVALIPATYHFVITPALFGEMVIKTNIKNCACQTCEERMQKRKGVHRFAFWNTGYAVRVAVISVLWLMCIGAFLTVKDETTLSVFIPHEILGVGPMATIPEIKRAYRKLSREKHPDKNPDNPQAVNEFIQIAKAYTILTDPVAAKNFAQYGNPDGGRASFHVSIALPRKIQEKEY